MGLFSKNPNEGAYIGGQKHFLDVIKNSGPGNALVYREPEEDFNTNSVLIVQPGETAIFVNNGTVQAVFENGRYQLSTQNYPFISRFRNALSGGISSFNSVVYFFRSTVSNPIRWGTPSPMQVSDMKYHLPHVDVRAFGSYQIRITDPALMLEQIVGNNVDCTTNAGIENFFQENFQGLIASTIAQYLCQRTDGLMGLAAQQLALSEEITPLIDSELQQYGLSCKKFSLASIVVDPTEYDKVNVAGVQKANMEMLGEDWARQQQVDIMKTMAANPGSVGAALGGGIAAGGMFMGMGQQVFSPQYAQTNAQSAQPAQAAPQEDPIETLSKLKKLLDAGLITQDDFDKKKTEVLSRM